MSDSVSTIFALNTVKGLEKEFIRKSIHLLIASVPVLASINIAITIGLLTAGTLIYSYAEMLRCSGSRVYFISSITVLAARERDRNRFVLGPVTLGLGALLTLLLYPNPAATIGIYALAFGDGLSSVVGKLLGRRSIPGFREKTIAGSVTCYLAVFLAAYAVSGMFFESLLIALAATFIEALPLKDFDNLLIPVGTAAFAQIVLQ